MKELLVAALIVPVALLGAVRPAKAGDKAAAVLTGVAVGIGTALILDALAPRPVVAAPVVYAPPAPPVVYQPVPIIVTPPPVVYAPPPVVYIPAPVVYRPAPVIVHASRHVVYPAPRPPWDPTEKGLYVDYPLPSVSLLDLGTVRLPRLIGHSHAMDLILTGRGVSGEEALRMGVVNRLVPKGQALAAALQLAHGFTNFPQRCLRSDRLSAYEHWSLPYEEALRNELEALHGGFAREPFADDSREYVFVARR